jgi:hypothetical protein
MGLQPERLVYHSAFLRASCEAMDDMIYLNLKVRATQYHAGSEV